MVHRSLWNLAWWQLYGVSGLKQFWWILAHFFGNHKFLIVDMLDTSCWIATKSLLPMPSSVLMVVVHARSGLACFHFILSSAMVRDPMDILPQIWWTLILGSGDAIQRQTSVRHFFTCLLLLFLPLVLWCCWLGGRKGVWPVKLSGGLLVLLSVWSEVQTYMWSSCCHCHTVTVSRFSEIQICFIFLVLAHLGSHHHHHHLVYFRP